MTAARWMSNGSGCRHSHPTNAMCRAKENRSPRVGSPTPTCFGLELGDIEYSGDGSAPGHYSAFMIARFGPSAARCTCVRITKEAQLSRRGSGGGQRLLIFADA